MKACGLDELKCAGQVSQAMRIMCLDFDGVVHPGPHCTERVDTPHFGWLKHLTRLLEPHPDVRVLVHSSWRENYSLAELRMILEEDVGDRVVGVAPLGQDRYAAIQAWVRENAPAAQLLILDDDRSAFPAKPPLGLVICNPCKGLSDPAVSDAVEAWLDSTATRRRG